MSRFIILLIEIWFTLSLIIISLPSLSCTTTNSTSDNNEVSYSTYCNTVVPEWTAQQTRNWFFPFNDPSIHISGGGAPILNRSSLKTVYFEEYKAYETSISGVIKVEVNLSFVERFIGGYNLAKRKNNNNYRILKFWLKGFLFQELGHICMVGFGSGNTPYIDSIYTPAVFKLNFRENSSILSSLSTATLDSLSSTDDSMYFQQISILMFHRANYEYSLVSKEVGNGGYDDGINIVSKSLPLPMYPGYRFCSTARKLFHFKLVYPHTCDSAKNCTPFGRRIGYLPRGVVFTSIQCDEEDHRFRVLIKFSEVSFNRNYRSFDWNYRSFDPKAALIGEAIWDEKKNQLQVVACKILSYTAGSSKKAQVGDCSIRLSLGYPATGSIRDFSYIRGNIWSRKSTNDSEYFDTIVFKTNNPYGGMKDLEYEYTQTEMVRKLCAPAKITKKSKKDRYPGANSKDMHFGILAITPDGKSYVGYSKPLYVGNHNYKYYFGKYAPTKILSSDTPMPLYPIEKDSTFQVPVNVSHKIIFSESIYSLNVSKMKHWVQQSINIEIYAEGIYDPTSGGLCMIGCKEVGSKRQPTAEENDLDCEIVVKVQFPSLNTKKNGGGYIKGSIESIRKTNDSLYFERLQLTSSAFISSMAKENISRMRFEIVLVLISYTLTCVFVAFQLFFVKKNPQTLPFASLIMLAVLSLSYMVPLLLNVEALLIPNDQDGKWIELNDMIVPIFTIFTMVAFLLQFRLLKLTWYSRRVNEKMNLWALEKKSMLYVLLPIYIFGALVTCVLNWMKNHHQQQQQRQLLGDLKCYAGLIVDGFLLPQIVLNIFGNTKENTLSVAYYVGTTFVQLFPHAYDLYRVMSSDQSAGGRFERSYIYANHGVDFYSIAWDVTIPCVALVFATIIFLQQRFGGRFILPRRFRDGEDYENVSVVNNDM